MNYLTTADWGARQKRSKKASRVRQLCIAKEIKGAKKIGRDWMIPANAKDPTEISDPQ